MKKVIYLKKKTKEKREKKEKKSSISVHTSIRNQTQTNRFKVWCPLEPLGYWDPQVMRAEIDQLHIMCDMKNKKETRTEPKPQLSAFWPNYTHLPKGSCVYRKYKLVMHGIFHGITFESIA